MEGIYYCQYNSVPVFTDHSSHSSNTVNHQQKKKPVQGKPERSAIRICGYWSEQLSSKGRIYFYNCMTEVSQWQKPSEWNLPDMSRKELLKLLNDRKASEEKKLKRTHSCLGPDGLASKEDLEVTSDSLKRLRYCNSADSRKSGTMQIEGTFPVHSTELTNSTQSSANCSGSRRFESYGEECKPAHQGSHRSHYNSLLMVHPKKEHVNNLPFRNSLADDMEISPNSSPLSDESSPLSVVNKGRSPSKPKCKRVSPASGLQRSQCPRLKPVLSSEWDPTKSGKSSSALCQLVDAIRASIGGLLDQSPGSSSFRHPLKMSPNTNGTVRLPRKSLCESTSNSNPQLTSPQPTNSLSTTITSKCSSSGVNTGFGRAYYSRDISNEPVPYTHDTGSVSLQSNACIASTVSSTNSSMCKQSAQAKCGSPSAISNSHQMDQRFANLTSHPPSQSTTQMSPSVIFSPRIPNQIPTYNRSLSGIQLPAYSSASGILLNESNGLPSVPHMTSNDFKHNRSTDHKSTYRDFSPGEFPHSKGHHSGTSSDVKSELLSPRSTSRNQDSNAGQLDLDDPLQRPIMDPHIHPRSQHSQLNDLVQVLKTALQQHQTPIHPVSSSSYPQNTRIISSHTSLLSPGLSIEKDPSTRLSTSSPDCRTQQNRFHANSGAMNKSGYDLWSCKDSSVDETHHKPSPSTSGSQTGSSTLPPSTIPIPDPLVSTANSADSNQSVKKADPSPKDELDPNASAMRIDHILESSDIQRFLDPTLISKYQDEVLQRFEQEAQMEWRKFDRLQSVLYAELSAESKKLRALVRISVAKLTIHKEKQTALQELMDVIETRKQLPNPSFSDNVL